MSAVSRILSLPAFFSPWFIKKMMRSPEWASRRGFKLAGVKLPVFSSCRMPPSSLGTSLLCWLIISPYNSLPGPGAASWPCFSFNSSHWLDQFFPVLQSRFQREGTWLPCQPLAHLSGQSPSCQARPIWRQTGDGPPGAGDGGQPGQAGAELPMQNMPFRRVSFRGALFYLSLYFCLFGCLFVFLWYVGSSSYQPVSLCQNRDFFKRSE